ncbi:FixH family protein [Sphingomonas daechungensis]|uniref:FixH family protein n=1 Tax=Sphingomonas daechungensis TaxID=1176646 RepID=UPI00378385C4
MNRSFSHLDVDAERTMLSTFGSKSWRNRYLWIVFPLMFLVVFSANGALVYFAVSSWPGLAYENASERGRKFNQVLAEESLENRLGWKFDLRHADGRIVLDARDASGAPLVDLDVTGTLVRPVGNFADQPLRFHPTSSGRYEAPLDAPMKGQWEVRFAAEHLSDRVHSAGRFFVR